MIKLNKSYKKFLHLPPGTFHLETPVENPMELCVISYSPDNFIRKDNALPEECLSELEDEIVTWVDVKGKPDRSFLTMLMDKAFVHTLVLEDILSPLQRSKIEDYGDITFIVVNNLFFSNDGSSIDQDKISVILGRNFVISFHQEDSGIFEHLKTRIAEARGTIRKRGSDYLLCSILDNLVDGFYPFLEELDNRADRMEQAIYLKKLNALEDLYSLKKHIGFVHRTMRPLREVINGLTKPEFPLVKSETLVFFRDINDHILQITDFVDSIKENITYLMEMAYSANSDRLNRIMKILTLVSTIFIPITFIAGIYGMNFSYMPELQTEWGYFAALGLMGVIAVGMIIFFKLRKWF